ncbi:MAG: hypothetical protein QXT84_00755 [Candidatus Bathyarchaeia archaeon]
MGFLPVRRGARRFFFADVRPEDKFSITERRVLLVRDSANIADTPAENRPRAVVAWEPFTVFGSPRTVKTSVVLISDAIRVVGLPGSVKSISVAVREPFPVGTVLAASRTASARVVGTVPVSGYVWFKPLSTYTREKAQVSDSFFRVKGSSRILATAPATPRDLFTASTRPVLTIKDSAPISSSLARQKPPYTLVADKVNTLDHIATSRTTSPLFYTLFAYRPRIRYVQLSVADRANVDSSMSLSKSVSPLLQLLFAYRPRIMYVQLSVADAVSISASHSAVRVPVVLFADMVGAVDVGLRLRAPAVNVVDRVAVRDVVPTASVSYVSMYGLQKLTVFAVELVRVRDSASAVLAKSARVVSAKDTVSVLDKFVLPIRTLLIADRVVVADKKV